MAEPGWWIAGRNGTRVGPFTDAQIEERTTTGEVTPDLLVWRAGMTDWAPAILTELARHWTSYQGLGAQQVLYNRGGVEPVGVDNVWAWAFVAVPFVLAFAQVQFGLGTGGMFIAALALYGIVTHQDSLALEAAGVQSPPAVVWGIVVVPVYLWQRANRVGVDQRIFAVWVAAFLLTFW